MLVKLKPCLFNTHVRSLTWRPLENQTCQSAQQKKTLKKIQNKTQQQEGESRGLRRLRLEWVDYSAAISGFHHPPSLLSATVKLGRAVQSTTTCVWSRRRSFFFFFPSIQVASVSWVPNWSQENSGKHVNWPVTTATRLLSAAAKQCTAATNTWFYTFVLIKSRVKHGSDTACPKMGPFWNRKITF